MRYAVDVLDSSKNKVAELTGMVSARLREKVNGIAVLSVETVERSEWEFLTPSTSFLRLRNITEGTSSTYRVMELIKSRDRERPSLRINARHILIDTADEIFSDARDCINYTPSDLVALVLGYSSYDAGTVEPAAVVPYVRFEYETVFECLLRICTLTGGELALDEDNSDVDILTSIGSDNGVIFRYGLNLKSAARRINTSRLANRIYGAGGGNPFLTLSGATSSGGKRYVEDMTSINTYGLHEASYHEPTLEEVVNLVGTPAFDGTYTAGLCEDWSKAGTPTVSKNTQSAYYLYGKASQRVQSTANGQGIEQQVTVSPGKVYSLFANIILTSGTVRVQIDDGTTVYKRAAAVTGSGLTTIRIENWKANNSTVTVKIFQEGSSTADFYADSVQLAEGARVKAFSTGKSADTLWERTVDYLNAHKDPEITYEVNLVDLYGDIRTGREADRFEIGDTVTVIDPTLDIEVETRVMERDIDILHPWRVSVRLDNASRSLADVLTAFHNAQQEGIKRTRTAMAESSTAAETGSTRLGFRNLAFRFFSTITVAAWNSVSWGAGTFRVGDAYYSIVSGSATGLSATSTYYFYFDRTSPTTFGNTTTIASAEGEDRLLVFTVTTTTSPTLCKIYPLGIVHV
ncbi:phage tail spike protein [Candidatus Latescibacterota bacterium]